MKNKIRTGVGIRLAALLLLSGSLYADNLTWGNTWVAVWSGFGTSPYTAIDHTTNKTISIFCLDFNDEIAPPMSWQANIYALNSANVTTTSQFGGNYGHGIVGAPFAFQGDTAPNPAHSVSLASSPTAYTRYLEAAWLFTNIRKAQAAGDVTNEVVSQVAAWDLFVEAQAQNLQQLTQDIHNTNGAANLTFNNYLYSTNNYASAPGTQSISGLQFEDAVDEALKAAQNAVVSENWAGSAYMPSWNLVTADPTWTTGYGKPVQEFLTDSIPNGGQLPGVPEPSAVILFGTVIAGVAALRRRKIA